MGYLVRTFSAVIEHIAEVLILAAGRFKIKYKVLHAQAKVIERILEFSNGLLHPLMAGLGFSRKLSKFGAIRLWESFDLGEELVEA